MKKILYFLLFALICSAFTTHTPLRSNKDYALFFAVNDYAPNSGFEDLSKPIENAEAVAQALRTRYGFQTEVVKNPTLDQIMAEATNRINALGKTKITPEISDDGLVFVHGGTFMMGCTSEQQDCYDQKKPAHSVTLNDFYIGRFEVTQKLWTQVMESNPSNFKNCDDCPVEQVSWEDVQGFLKKLNQQSGKQYRLPTEAEWEYAARGGGKSVLFGNGKNTIDPKEINFDARESYKMPYSVVGLYRQKTVAVGSLNSPNDLGLHDMSGNVWEWCNDWYGDYPSESQINPTGPSTGSFRVLRGGSWFDYPQFCRVAYRGIYSPSGRVDELGFRLARTK